MTKRDRKAYMKEYREINKERIKERRKKYYENNKERIKEYKKEYREINKEQIKEYDKKYRENNKEQIKESNKKYRENNKERRKEYKKEYRENLPAGIYKIANIITGTTYIGQSSQYPLRWLNHKRYLRKDKHPNPQLQEDYNTYGEEAFVFEVIEELPCDTSSGVLLEKEAEQIKKHLNEGKKIYNCLN